MKLDILAIGVHPDDIELGCGGTLVAHIKKGKTVGLLDLTRGELGSRGTVDIRDAESEKAKNIIGAVVRENLNLADGFFENNQESQIKLIQLIRKYKPEIILCNAVHDRHPDHGRSAELVEDACFYSGLIKIITEENGIAQTAWRPKIVLHYIQDRYIIPDIVVDISATWDKKMESVLAHASQFYSENSTEPETYIASKQFLETVTSRHMEFGRSCGFTFAEGFTCGRIMGITNLFELF
jgi:bacillithiol biosynthesis deacetylase BshB1